MAIAPLSDIVLDVAGAADPVRRQAAVAKLAQLAGAPSNTSFSQMLDSRATAAAPAASNPVLPTGGRFGLVENQESDPKKVYQKFEAVFLQNFVADILPKDDELYGDAASADICRSMLAEQLADQIAKTGKIGLTAKISAAHPALGRAAGLAAPLEAPAGPSPRPSGPVSGG